MTVLVTGGTGFVGRHLVAALLREGVPVRVLGRDFAGMEAALATGAEHRAVDLRDRRGVIAACEGIETVFHIGALSAPWGKRADFAAINVGGTESVIAGCRRYGVRRLVYVSSPSVIFDGHDHIEATEALPYPHRFTSVYSLTKKLGEDRVKAAARAGLETVILRPKAIFGPGDRSLLPRLVAAAECGRLPQIGDGRNLVDLTYVENVVHALRLARTAPADRRSAAIGHTYTITNGEHVPLWEAIRAVLRRLGLSDQLRRMPLRAALGTAGAMELRAALTGREPLLTRYSAAILARTQTYDITAARRDLGYEPVVSFADGMERTLAALVAERSSAALPAIRTLLARRQA
jgi:nucleoside-diphosphate-sugar epimerase